MQNRFKVLLLILCFGSLCLLLPNAPVKNRHRYLPKEKETIAENDKKEEKYIQLQTTEVEFDLTHELRSKLENEFESRRSRIEYLCSALEINFNSTLHNTISKMVVDIKHSLTWCPIYKSASSLWMKSFTVLSGFSTPNSLQSVYETHLDYQSIVKQKFQQEDRIEKKLEQINTATKFMVVRHPFERLLSAYRDKLEHIQGREYYYRRYGQYITHRYRLKESNLTSLEPSFTEFLLFISKEKRFDEHWAPFFDTCQPCSIDYDYIFKFDSLSSEYNFFIAENSLNNYLNYIKKDREDKSFQGITNDLVAEKYFKQVPASLLLSIFKIYQLDFLLFSYSPTKYYYMTNDANKEAFNFVSNK